MTSNLPSPQLFSTLPQLPEGALLMSTFELRDRLALLDAGGDFGVTERHRWEHAAAEGKWTADELLAAVEWLNVNHDGFVKIAHVHKRIETLRSRVRLARMFCWQHPNAIAVVSAYLDKPVDAAAVERFWQDYRYEWLNDGVADDIMATQTDAQWIRWAEAESKNFRSEL